jgi:hypothetical protein
MGTQYLPMAMGNFLGGFIAGGVYNQLADKYVMIHKLLPELEGTQSLSNNQLFEAAANYLRMDPEGLNRILWETYHPWLFGGVLIGIGIFTVSMLFLYDRLMAPKKSN